MSVSGEGSRTSAEAKPEVAVTAAPASLTPTVNVIDPQSNYRRSIWQWFHPDDGPAERKLIIKLDLFILSFACIGFWALYIDRGIFTNAYVSGMREDLGMYGNQFVQANALFTSGYAISIIPLTVLNTRLPPQYVIPISMVLWGLFTILVASAKNYQEVYGYRFLTGFAEGAFFPSIHYIFGSWYRPDEITRRAGVYYIAACIGTATTGFLAAGVYSGLNGAQGRAGWRWMFIIGGVVTFPIAIFGLVTFPGTPDSKKSWLLTREELEMARERMRLVGREPTKTSPFKFSLIKRFLGNWHFWVLIPWIIIVQQGYLSQGQGTWTLWIKSQPQYSTVAVNNLSTINPLVGIIWVVAFSAITDRYGHKSKLPIFAFANTVMFLGHLAFVLYDKTPVGYKWFAVATGMIENSTMPVVFSWANLICKHDAEERAFILGAMLSFAMAFNSWVPVVSLPTVLAPKYPGGYIVMLVTQPLAFAGAVLVYYLDKEGRNPTLTRPKEAAEANNTRVVTDIS